MDPIKTGGRSKLMAEARESSAELGERPAEDSAGALAQGSLPGLVGLDHVGLTVPDLEAATRFLVDVLGCEHLYSLGPLADRDGAWMQTHLNVDPRAVARVRFFRCGSNPVLEVFEYTAPDQRTAPPRNSDVGGHHVALYVDDLDAAVRYLKAREVQVLGEPTTSAGPHEGQRWVYFLTPWGAQFELVSYPHGRAWYRARAEQSSRGAEQ
jgi:catechol 2,3-dioxygenase-like lactoylglutathione lyase family enzyme